MTNIRNNRIIKIFGLRVQELRVKKGLSQEELSYQADIPISQIGRVERGEINPTISTIFALSKALNVPMRELLDIE